MSWSLRGIVILQILVQARQEEGRQIADHYIRNVAPEVLALNVELSSFNRPMSFDCSSPSLSLSSLDVFLAMRDC